MNLVVGYVPYLNMSPFHIGFGPESVRLESHSVDFRTFSPKALGIEAEKGSLDAGAFSLVDSWRLKGFEPLGSFGIGMKGPARSVLFFSRMPISEFAGMAAVTDETATSVRLLQVLLEKRYGNKNIRYGRVASRLLFDGSSEGLLLIGNEGLKAQREGIRGLPFVSDLGSEWIDWQGTPFAFARWMVKRSLPQDIKDLLYRTLKNSLVSAQTIKPVALSKVADRNGFLAEDVRKYWDAFDFNLTPSHDHSIAEFKRLTGDLCLSA